MDEAKLKEFYLNKLKIKELTDRNEEIVVEEGLRDAEVGNYSEGRYIVEVSRNARFDAAVAEEKFPLGENGENMAIYRATVDSTKAKKHLTPAEYESCQKVFPKNKVEIKLV